MLVELKDLNQRRSVDVVDLYQAGVVHRRECRAEFLFLAPRRGEDRMLNREGIAGHPAVVVAVRHQQRIQALREL